jgi:outer membrane protein assembly factor BamB
MSDVQDRIYAGAGGYALAVNPDTGEEIWRTALCVGVPVISVILTDGRLFASGGGELWRLDPLTGQILWRRKLKGLGVGFVSVAVPAPEEERGSQVARISLISGAAASAASRRMSND